MAKLKTSAKGQLERMVEASAKQVKKSVRKKTAQSLGYLPGNVAHRLQEQIDEFGRTIQNIPLTMIKLNENIRKNYSEDSLATLATSLEQDGLIQFPTLCLKLSPDGTARLICRNGHRRILAAKRLGWNSVDCMILSFDSASQELYHTINANINENVFYLDLALAYQEAANLGESDADVGKRVGVNERTVGWYRRLALMPASCRDLCRQYPDIFNATWAIKLARKGVLPKESDLLQLMKTYLDQKIHGSTATSRSANKDRLLRQKARHSLRKIVAQLKTDEEQILIRNLLNQLTLGGFLSKQAYEKLQKDLFAPAGDKSHTHTAVRGKRTRSKRA